jgi:hypothetical protein
LRAALRLERLGVFVAVLSLVIGLGLAAELRTYARPDTGFLLDAAGRVLDGSRLYVDVVEINPPLIVALNLPAVLLGRLLGISDILVYRLGFTLALLAALALAARLVLRALPEDTPLRHALIVLLAFVLFPLAGQDFGEREHLVLALVVPYLLLAAARAQGRELPRGLALGAGLLAGLAFALKPHFLIVWMAVELGLRLGRRAVPRAALPETLGIAGFLAVYGAAVLVFAPQYLALVRLLAGPYGRFLYDPFLHLLVTGPGTLLTIFALLSFVALRGHTRHPEVWRFLALGVVACLVAGAAQQKGLRYHFYPSFALATLLLGGAALDARTASRALAGRVYRAAALCVVAGTVLVVAFQNAVQAAGRASDPERRQLETLIKVVRAHAAGESVYVMSYHLGSAYPLINYSGARSASRFPQLWILAADYRDALERPEPLRYHSWAEMSPSERYLNVSALEDLRAHRPRLLLVYRAARDLPRNGYRRLNYVAYFGRDQRFADIFRRYQLIAQTGDYDVYQRLAEGERPTAPPPGGEPGTHDILPTGAAAPAGSSRYLAAAALAVLLAGVLAALRFGRAGSRTAGSARTAGYTLPDSVE